MAYQRNPKQPPLRIHWTYFDEKKNVVVTACGIYLVGNIQSSDDRDKTTCWICIRSRKYKGF